MPTPPVPRSLHSRFSRRAALRAGVAGAGLAAFLAACGGSDSGAGEPKQSSGGPPINNTAPTVTSQPKKGGKVTYAYSNVPQNLDMHKLISPTLTQMASLTTNRLLRHETGPASTPTDYKVIPDLAESFEQPDATTISLRLRQGVKWHNKPPYNGRELTAKDVVRSFERQATKQAAFIYAYLLDWVESFSTPDARTLVIKAKEPFARGLPSLALRENSVLPVDSAEQFGSLEKPEAWAGTGPYTLTDWKPGVGFTFDRNPNYWEPNLPHIDKVELREITDPATQLSAFLAGELDQIDDIASELVTTLKGARTGDARLLQYSAVGGAHYAWTVKTGPFRDERVRKAWDLLIDRQSMIAAITSGAAEYRVGPLSPGFTGVARTQEAIKGDAKADLAEAKKLLEAAGLGAGFKAGMLGNSAVEKAWIEWAVQQGKKANIEIVPQVVERTVYLTAQREHKFDLGQIYAIRAYDDPDEYLYPLFYTGASKNYFDVADPRLDELILKQRRAVNPEERKKVLQEIDARWTKDFNYHSFAYTDQRTDAVKNRLKNYQVRVVSEYSQLRYAWIEG